MSERATMTKPDIYRKVVAILAETFDLKPEVLTSDALLVQDLDLDSIDAVDLVVKLQQYTNKKIDPETFKQIRTINDVVEVLFRLEHDDGTPGS
jgi:acyl carrier protein